jgi:tRNA (Thr-GGU) A37 N-methylase
LCISVRELDAIDGTPVLDIKPYMEESGPREPVRQPVWSNELMAPYFRPKTSKCCQHL